MLYIPRATVTAQPNQPHKYGHPTTIHKALRCIMLQHTIRLSLAQAVAG